jgi:hypothetical protein
MLAEEFAATNTSYQWIVQMIMLVNGVLNAQAYNTAEDLIGA